MGTPIYSIFKINAPVSFFDSPFRLSRARVAP
jgi:hypothetical protein